MKDSPPVHQPARFERVAIVAPVHQVHPKIQQSFVQKIIAMTTLQQGKHHRHRRHQHPHHHPRLHHLLRQLEQVGFHRQLLRHPDFGLISHGALCATTQT